MPAAQRGSEALGKFLHQTPLWRQKQKPRQSGAAFQTDWHQKALTLINELGPLVFCVPQRSFLPRPVRRPQMQPGHKRGCGLYFGEVTQAQPGHRFFKPCTKSRLGVQVEKVEAALKDMK